MGPYRALCMGHTAYKLTSIVYAYQDVRADRSCKLVNNLNNYLIVCKEIGVQITDLGMFSYAPYIYVMCAGTAETGGGGALSPTFFAMEIWAT